MLFYEPDYVYFCSSTTQIGFYIKNVTRMPLRYWQNRRTDGSLDVIREGKEKCHNSLWEKISGNSHAQ